MRAGERTAAEVDELGGRGLFVATDVTDQAQIDGGGLDRGRAFGRLDVVVNNAWGGGTIKRLEHKTDEDMLHGVRARVHGDVLDDAGGLSPPEARGWRRHHHPVLAQRGQRAHVLGGVQRREGGGACAHAHRGARVGRHGIRANVICPAAATEAYEAFKAMAPDERRPSC